MRQFLKVKLSVVVIQKVSHIGWGQCQLLVYMLLLLLLLLLLYTVGEASTGPPAVPPVVGGEAN